MKYFVYYLLAVNLLAALVCISDKRRSIKGKRRISEKALFIWSLLGGSVGIYLTMLAIRHKTKHKRFMIGLPLIIILQVFAAAAVFKFI
ncbi:MAG: DUF1294 domain-containing protein [Clostridiales bacterium]|nr:DUF1294 domain-containing protein [Candidatus Equinaster intestinalis]